MFFKLQEKRREKNICSSYRIKSISFISESISLMCSIQQAKIRNEADFDLTRLRKIQYSEINLIIKHNIVTFILNFK